MADRKEMVTWEEVERLISHLIPQFTTEFDSMVIVTRGGVVPGGMLCEALNIENVMTASVDFPFESQREAAKLLAWPQFIQFPPDAQLTGRKVLAVDDVWGSGRTIMAVKNRVSAAGGFPATCVLYFNPHRSLFSQGRPDYYAAVTDAYIIFPWEANRGVDKVLLRTPEQG